MGGPDAPHDPDAPWRRGYAGPPPVPVGRDGSIAGDDPATPESPRPMSNPTGPPSPEAVVESPSSAATEPPGSSRTVSAPGVRSVPVPAGVEGLPASAVTGQLVLGAVGVVGAVLAAVLVATSLVVGPSPAPVADTPELPATAAVRWSAQIDTRVDDAAIGPDVVVVVSDVGDVVAFDSPTGAQRWRAGIGESLSVTALGVVDGVVVVADSIPGARARIHALDVVTGAVRWKQASDAAGYGIVEQRPFRLSYGRTTTILQFLDPLDGTSVGAPIERDVGSVVTAPAPYFASVVEGRLTLIDLDTLDVAAGPVAAGDLRFVTLLDGHLVGVTEQNVIVVVDDDGNRIDEQAFESDAFGDFAGRAELVGPNRGGRVAIVASGSSVGFRVIGGAISVVWTLPGRVGAPLLTDVGAVSVARLVDAATGEVNDALVDPETGDVIAVTDAGVTRERDPVVGRDGFLLAPEIGEPDRVLSAIGYDGSERWALTLPKGPVDYLADHGVLVTTERQDGGRSIVTAYG
jgi:hypothetical protein